MRITTNLVGRVLQASLLASAILTFVQSDFGQTNRVPPPDFVKIATQPDSPVALSLTEGLFQPSPNYYPVTYSLQNVGTKPIRSLVVTGFPKDPNHSLGVGALQPGSTRSVSFGNLSARKPDETFTLTVDYVLFNDGTHWGEDKAGESAFLLGYIEGATKFYKEIKQRLDQDNDEAVTRFLSEPHKILQSERRGRRDEGIAHGYAYWLNTVKFELQNSGDPNGIAPKVRDLGMELGVESPLSKGVRSISKTTYKDEPVNIVELKEGSRTISFGKDYTSVDWLKDLSVSIKNNSGKTITYLSLGLDFVETLNNGNRMVYTLRYGDFAGGAQTTRFEDLPVPTGGLIRLVLDEKQFESLKRFIASRQSLDSLSRLNLSIEMVQYDDRTGWSMGGPMKQDPENPRRWIPAN